MRQVWALVPNSKWLSAGNGAVIGVDDRLCGLVVRVPGYRTEMYCASCEVRTEFIYVI
jgi:hypothetical protein